MARANKYVKFVLHVIFLVVASYLIKQKSIKPIITKKIGRYSSDIRYLLIWTNVPGLEHEGQKHFLERQCASINCYLTWNRTFLEDVRYFDGVIFNLQDVSGQSYDLPQARSMTQKYVFTANDSSDNYPVCNSVYDNFFNWTWSYRIDSTIQYRFFSFKNLNDFDMGNTMVWKKSMKPIDENFQGLLSTKSKAAAIFLDKCTSRSKRELFVKILQKELAKFNLTVDVYGECGPKKCGRTMNSCFYKLKKNYYFYLAFEDSISLDFVTRSVMYGYQNNAVPVVYGGAPYHRYLPLNSYLDALELGEQRLARLMYDIIGNKRRYYDYFRWRNHYAISESTILDPCVLCQTFNNPEWLLTKFSMDRLRLWWNPDFEQRCGVSRRIFSL